MKIEYKGKVHEVVKETAKMYYITKSKRVFKTSCKVVDEKSKPKKPVRKVNKPMAKKEIKRIKDLVVEENVIIVAGDETYKGNVTHITRENNKRGVEPHFSINNNIDVRYVFGGGIKVYKD